jgi:serine/threonine protein kinase
MLIVCSNCQSKSRVPDSAAGKKGKCPKCGAIVAIPLAEPAAAAPPLSNANAAAAPAPPADPTPTPAKLQPGEAPTVASTVPPSPAGETPVPDTGQTPAARHGKYTFLAPPQAADELGRLGPYRVLKVLGEGGMGVVFIAEDVRLKRQVALKAMLPDVATKPAARERFLREARTAAAIEHDHIVAIFQVDEDRGVPYIAMPLLKGCSLEDWLRRQPPGTLPVPLILRLGRQVAEGLAAAHAHGLIHRDIKPANIFLQGAAATGDVTLVPSPAADFRVKILDFGLARLTAGEQHLTLSGVIMGTPAYMAPEQARSGSKVDHRADLFSLGIVLYRLATGTLPFKGEDMMSTLMSVAMDRPLAPRVLCPELPPELSDLVMKLLEKEPDDRFVSADEVVAAISTLESSSSSPTAPAARALPEPVLLESTPRSAPAPAPPPLPREHADEEEEPRRRAWERDDDHDEDWDRLRIEKQEAPGMSLASMIVGICAATLPVILCYIGAVPGAICGIVAIVLGVIGRKRGGASFALTGIICGSAGLLISLGWMLFFLGICMFPLMR